MRDGASLRTAHSSPLEPFSGMMRLAFRTAGCLHGGTRDTCHIGIWAGTTTKPRMAAVTEALRCYACAVVDIVCASRTLPIAH